MDELVFPHHSEDLQRKLEACTVVDAAKATAYQEREQAVLADMVKAKQRLIARKAELAAQLAAADTELQALRAAAEEKRVKLE